MTESCTFPKGHFDTELCYLNFLRVSSSVCAFAFGAGEDDCPSCLSAHLFSRCGILTDRRGRLSFLFTIGSVAETTGVSFRTLSNFFPLIQFLHFLFCADFSPFLTRGYCPSLNYFVLDSEDSRPHCRLSSIWNSSAVHWFEYFLFHTKSIQCDAEQNPVILPCINALESFP